MFVQGAVQHDQVNLPTGTTGQTLIALYDTAIRHARQGARSIQARQLVAKGKELQRVSSIIAELASTLDHAVAPQLCANLEQLYGYIQRQLALASARMDPAAAEEVASLLGTLRDAWIEAVERVEGPSEHGFTAVA